MCCNWPAEELGKYKLSTFPRFLWQNPSYNYTRLPRGTRNGPKLCEAPRGTRGEVRAEARPKIVLAGREVKMPQGPQDGCRGVASATLGMRRDFARVLRALGGQNMQSPAQKSCAQVRGSKHPQKPRRVSYNLGGGGGGWPLRHSEWSETLRGSLTYNFCRMSNSPVITSPIGFQLPRYFSQDSEF